MHYVFVISANLNIKYKNSFKIFDYNYLVEYLEAEQGK